MQGGQSIYNLGINLFIYLFFKTGTTSTKDSDISEKLSIIWHKLMAPQCFPLFTQSNKKLDNIFFYLENFTLLFPRARDSFYQMYFEATTNYSLLLYNTVQSKVYNESSRIFCPVQLPRSVRKRFYSTCILLSDALQRVHR